jgi:glutathione S-transferase
MKLYFKQGACPLAPHILMAELGFVYELEAVDTMTKITATGENFFTVNPKGSVPALKMDDGRILTEGAAIMQYLCDQKPQAQLMKDKYPTLEWMNFIATEIHKGVAAFFYVDRQIESDAGRTEMRKSLAESLEAKLNFVSHKLGANSFLMGNEFQAPDAYMFTCLTWTKLVNFDLAKWPNIVSYMVRMYEHPSVQRAMKEEGMI